MIAARRLDWLEVVRQTGPDSLPPIDAAQTAAVARDAKAAQ